MMYDDIYKCDPGKSVRVTEDQLQKNCCANSCANKFEFKLSQVHILANSQSLHVNLYTMSKMTMMTMPTLTTTP